MAGRPKSSIDWEAIEAQYRTGAYSYRRLAKVHGCSEAGIRQHATREGWTRDLLGQARAAARIKLLSTEGAATAEERQLIDSASDRMASLVRRHQRHFERLSDAAELMARHVLSLAQGKKPKYGKLEVDALGNRESIADALAKVAQATSRFIPLERKSHGIDDASAGEDLASWLKAQSDLD